MNKLTTNNIFGIHTIDSWYGQLVTAILEDGARKVDRTGTGTFSMFGGAARFDCGASLPLLSLKKTNWQWAVQEMIWFLSGSTNIKDLGNPIWDQWATEAGEVGPIYGKQWRQWQCDNGHVVDQFSEALHVLKTRPYSRRIIVEGWNVARLPSEIVPAQTNVKMGNMSLAPCHKHFQFVTTPPANDGEQPTLNMHMYQRSADTPLGVPFNIVQYAFLLKAVAQYVGMNTGILQISYGDIHIYTNQVDGAEEVLRRYESLEWMYAATPNPQMVIAAKHPLELTIDDVSVTDYNPQDFIKFKVSV